MAAPAHIARENGKKGGRPKGSVSEATRVGMLLKEKLALRVEKEYGPMLDAIVDKCKKGDVAAWKDVLDRLAGKATEHIDVKTDGQPIQVINYSDICASPSTFHQKK